MQVTSTVPRPIEQIDFSILDRLKANKVTRISPWLVGLIIIMLPLIAAIGVFLAPVFVVGIIYLAIRVRKAREHDKAILAEFALANGLGFSPTWQQFHTGTLFDHGHSKKGTNCISGVIAGYPANLFRYDYTVGYGKNRRDYDALVMEVALPRKMPHMVIDSKVESGFGGSVLPIQFDSSQKIELEGDFHKYFSLYAPDSYGISALTIIAPDAMETLLRHASLCDIEIIDNRVFFYWPDAQFTRKGVEDKFATVKEVLEEIGRKLSGSDIYARPEQAALHSTPTASAIRLKPKSYKWLLISLFPVILLAFFLSQVSDIEEVIERGQWALGGLWALLFFGVPLSIIYQVKKESKLRKSLEERYPK